LMYPFIRIHCYMTIDILDRLTTLGDATRVRILGLLETNELTVSELLATLQLPQSTVSRHLKVLAADGWVRARAEGRNRHYRFDGAVEESARDVWRVVREEAGRQGVFAEDRERLLAVLARRRERSRAFFSHSAEDWDELRAGLFGTGSEMLPLLGLLDHDWVAADLGSGTGAFAALIAPYVSRVDAVDGSDEMLAAAARRLASLDGVDNVALHAGDLEALPLADASVDVAFLVLVLHYVVHPGKVLAEACRTLKPGGRVVIVDMREHDREHYRDEMGHVWMGFGARQMRAWASEAGLVRYRQFGMIPAADARGPLLFMSHAERAVGTAN
jgi:ubiquinone/menaquinone biosynthesis C-methylase UbiE/DNA-binding transcriptional ArsR family regulator